MAEPTTTPILLKLATDVVMHLWRHRSATTDRMRKDVEVKIDRHIVEVLKWSQRIQFYGMSRAEETDAATISLRINVEPRRFRSSKNAGTLGEFDLLNDDHNYLLLGDPGAGKTTTLKRLAQHLVSNAPDTAADIYQFPVVLRLRELDLRESIIEMVANAVGIGFERRTERDEIGEIISVDLWVGQQKLRDVIVEFLNLAHVVLILDGLDEAPGDSNRLNRELSWLALNTSGSKVIVSSRSGDYTGAIEGFDIIELCPLDADEIAVIARLWLGDPSEFLAKLAELPYRDITDRPLLLTQLLFIYKRYGYLPEQPSQIYRRVISLLLQEWDAERGVVRRSKYAQFDPDRKAAFLAALAYELTYRIKRKVFASRDLRAAYLKIYQRFRLPQNEMHQVISEIETHTGIIVAAGPDMYEFSHLSLQEFLCAEYLIREPHSEYLTSYLAMYPAPVAIAIALSSNPSLLFAALFLRSKEPAIADIRNLISRLLLEQPFFDVSPYLGTAIMRLYRDFADDQMLSNVLYQLLHLPSVTESVVAALYYFEPSSKETLSKHGLLHLRRVRALEGAQGIKTPDAVAVPLALIREIAERGNSRAQHFLGTVNNNAEANSQRIVP